MTTPMMATTARRRATCLLAPLLALALPGALAAQQPASGAPPAQSASADPRWQGFVGCWRPAPPPVDLADAAGTLGIARVDMFAPLLCVVPAGGQAVEMLTVADGKVIAHESVDASGSERTRTRDGCNGVESARWSGDSRRIYLRSEYTCPGDIKRTSNGLLAISTGGELLDVQGVVSGRGKSVRVARYQDAGSPSSLPAAIAGAIAGRAMAVAASRSAASAPITASEIIDASRNLDAPVVQAWLIESGQRFSVDAKSLVRLADAGVPGGVTDVLVALSHPRIFSVDRATFAGDVRALAGGSQVAGGPRTIYGGGYPPSVGGYYNGYYDPYFSAYDRFGYSRFGYSPFGYGSYGGYGSYPLGGVPVIIIRDGPTARHGKAVNGRGYTRNDPPSSAPLPRHEPRNAEPASNGNSGSSTTRSSGSSGSSSSEGTRQAKPRP